MKTSIHVRHDRVSQTTHQQLQISILAFYFGALTLSLSIQDANRFCNKLLKLLNGIHPRVTLGLRELKVELVLVQSLAHIWFWQSVYN